MNHTIGAMLAAGMGLFSMLAWPAEVAARIFGHPLTGSILIVDGFHNPGSTPGFTIPAGGGVLTAATVLNDSDSSPASVDLLVLRPGGGANNDQVIDRVRITDDAPVANSGTTSYPLANLAVQAGDVQITNLTTSYGIDHDGAAEKLSED